ncbi:MAG: DUF1778 domain-containing protein [Alphaproteobacteria bacterium]|nr:DUF1778 domain-containing protein [Alphaproteobacteria bacterium]MDE2493677.1 DUF1778 domain-containing protein [Alphaproteobacteria bacterium]
MPAKTVRTNRVEARISPSALAIVKRAAEIQGRSLSDFVVAAAQDAAQRTIAETQIVQLSVADQKALVESLLNPPDPSAALRRAKRAYDRLIVKPR